MALMKSIVFDNGLTLNYHRIAELSIETNVRNGIMLVSYQSKDDRNVEKENEGARVYTEKTYMAFDYIDGMTIESAYNYLKTLPEFKDAANI